MAKGAIAQTGISTAGSSITVSAYSEVKQTNNQAHAIFTIEEQDADKAVAASRVNQKMNQLVSKEEWIRITKACTLN